MLKSPERGRALAVDVCVAFGRARCVEKRVGLKTGKNWSVPESIFVSQTGKGGWRASCRSIPLLPSIVLLVHCRPLPLPGLHWRDTAPLIVRRFSDGSISLHFRSGFTDR